MKSIRRDLRRMLRMGQLQEDELIMRWLALATAYDEWMAEKRIPPPPQHQGVTAEEGRESGPFLLREDLFNFQGTHVAGKDQEAFASASTRRCPIMGHWRGY
jgi:hypothetical protein